MRRLLMIILPPMLAVIFAGTAFAQSITLAWDANTESNIAGYKVYYKTGTTSTSYNGTEADQGASPVDVGANTTITLTGLDGSQPHSFVVTAYNTDGQESTYSAAVSSAVAIVTALAMPSEGTWYAPRIVEGSRSGIFAAGSAGASMKLTGVLGAGAWAFDLAMSGLFFPLVLGVWGKRANTAGAIAGVVAGLGGGSWVP